MQYTNKRPEEFGFYWIKYRTISPPIIIRRTVARVYSSVGGESPDMVHWEGEDVGIHDIRLMFFAGPIEPPEEDEQELANMVRVYPTLQTHRSGSVLQKFAALANPPITKWVHMWKGEYIDWRAMAGRDVMLESNPMDGTVRAHILEVIKPEKWYWEKDCGDDAGVVFTIHGEECKCLLSVFVTLVRSFVTPLV